ncbi:sugar phosphate isomerase/epimerase family protein [Thermodesulfobacteriota bacterium]
MTLKDICTPGLVICQLFPNARKTKGVNIAAMRHAAGLNFYGAFEIADTLDRNERKEIKTFVQEREVKLVYWLSFIQYDAGISISALDENERTEAIGRLIEQIPNAFECGADFIGFISGPDVAIDRRNEAKKQLSKSIREMVHAAKQFGPMRFLLESLDREAHKKNLIGPTNEAVNLILQLRDTVPELYLNFDVAHIKLLAEEPIESLSTAIGVISEIHLANCVDNPKSPLFGDNHIPIGDPGFLTSEYIADLFKKGLDLGFLGPTKPVVSPEVFCAEGDDPWDAEKNGRENMIRAWEKIST